MPSGRRLKITALLVLLTFLIVLYVSNGARSTHTSPFYTRTVESLKSKQAAESRTNVIAEEQQRLDRVERLQKEHDVAVAAAAGGASTPSKDQAQAAAAPAEAQDDSAAKVKPVAGRHSMTASPPSDGRIVDGHPLKDGDDGVAKIGNVDPIQKKQQQAQQAQKDSTSLSPDSSSSSPKNSLTTQDDKQPTGPETETSHLIDTELNSILKRGPIIIFSKSYCPYSKKAKHILLDLYNITPAPYVVELDLHELGPGLQAALEKSTGRRTVPNVLINGKSIGGGDDVEALHVQGKLAETVTAMGGKRVMEVVRKEGEKGAEGAEGVKLGLKFRA